MVWYKWPKSRSVQVGARRRRGSGASPDEAQWAAEAAEAPKSFVPFLLHHYGLRFALAGAGALFSGAGLALYGPDLLSPNPNLSIVTVLSIGLLVSAALPVHWLVRARGLYRATALEPND